MIPVSSEFKQEIAKDNRAFTSKIEIVTQGGINVLVDDTHIMQGGFNHDDSTSTQNSFDVGSVIANKFTLIINNMYDDFSMYDFNHAIVKPSIGLDIGGTVEWVRKGTFIVDEPSYNGSFITMVCEDYMTSLDIPYVKINTIYPANLRKIVQDITTFVGVTFNTLSFDMWDFVVKIRPNDDALTCRMVLNWVCLISGSYARFNHLGQLEIKWYDKLQTAAVIDKLKSITVAVEDIEITGIQVTDGEESSSSVLVGNTTYALELPANKLIDNAQLNTVALHLGNKIVGMKFRPLSVQALNDPTIESGDRAKVIDRKENEYMCYLTNVSFRIGATTTYNCDAESPKQRAKTRYTENQIKIIETNRKVEEVRLLADQAAVDAVQAIDDAFAAYQLANTAKGTADTAFSRSVKSSAVEYAKNTSATTPPTTGWSFSIPTILPTEYLWTRTTLTLQDNSTTVSYQVGGLGKDGAPGADGTSVTVASTSVSYQVGTSATTAPTGTWQSTPQATTVGQFLWTRTIVNYNPSGSTTSYSVSAHGSTGPAGVGVSSSTVTYQAHTNGTTPPTGTWVSAPPSVSAGQFLWSRTVIVFTDATSVTMYSVAMMGTNGTNGSPGTNAPTITLVKELFKLHTSNSTPPTAPVSGNLNGWTYTIPTYITGQFYWRVLETTFSDATVTYSTPIYDLQYNDVKTSTMALDTLTQSHTTTLSQHATAISLKAEQTDLDAKANKATIISEINLSPESIRLLSSRIDVDGVMTVINSGGQSGNTRIDGGIIMTDSIFARTIAVGDFLEYSTVSEKYPKSMMPSGYVFGQTVITSGYISKAVATNQYLALTGYEANQFTVGDELYVEFEIYGAVADSANGVRLVMWTRTVTGGFNNLGNPISGETSISSAQSAPNVNVGTTVSKYTGKLVVPPTNLSTATYYFIMIEDTRATKSQLYVRNVNIRLRNRGNLIVDGAITAVHLNVATLSAITANMGTLTAGLILNTDETLSFDLTNKRLFTRSSDKKESALLSSGTLTHLKRLGSDENGTRLDQNGLTVKFAQYIWPGGTPPPGWEQPPISDIESEFNLMAGYQMIYGAQGIASSNDIYFSFNDGSAKQTSISAINTALFDSQTYRYTGNFGLSWVSTVSYIEFVKSGTNIEVYLNLQALNATSFTAGQRITLSGLTRPLWAQSNIGSRYVSNSNTSTNSRIVFVFNVAKNGTMDVIIDTPTAMSLAVGNSFQCVVSYFI